jgi:hypothetical protein
MEKDVVQSKEERRKAPTADRSFNRINFPRLSHDFLVDCHVSDHVNCHVI